MSDLEFRVHTPIPYTTLDSFFAHSYTRLLVTSKAYHEQEANAADPPDRVRSVEVRQLQSQGWRS